jgi:hypothetical protein
VKKLSWLAFPFLAVWAALVHLAGRVELLTPRAETNLFLLWWISLAVIYDLLVVAQHGSDPTITRTLQRWVSDFPVLLVFLGGLLWHLFGTGGTYKQ